MQTLCQLGLNDSDRLMNRLKKDILFIKKSDKVVLFAAAGVCGSLIAVRAAVLDLMLIFFPVLMDYGTRGQEDFSVFYMSFLLFSVFFR